MQSSVIVGSMRWGLLTLLVLTACSDDGGVVATYDVPASGTLAWGDVPFPNDLYLGADGTVDMAPHEDWTALWQTVSTTVSDRTGFCGTCSVHIPVSGPLDRASLDGNVVLADGAGNRIPAIVQWDALGEVIAITPTRGTVLEPGARYFAGVTNKVRAENGSALRAANGFTSQRARAVTEPAIAALKAAGVTDEIVSATAFTVEDPRWLANDIHARVQSYVAATGAPAITVKQVWKVSDGSLDALLGIPEVSQAGLDNPSQDGTIGKHAIAHDTVAVAVKGTFKSVRVISGSGSELGTLDGQTRAGDDVPFLLIVPTGVDVTNLPVIVFHHGAGGVVGHLFALADMAGKAHVALLGLETFLHGERSPTVVDDFHALRGDDGELGPDGFAEQNTLQLTLQFLSIDGAPPDQKGSPLYGLGATAQMAADYHMLLQLVAGSNLSAIAAADASLTGLAFDQTRVFYLGLSLGTVVGSIVLAADTIIDAGVFNVPPASLTEAFCEMEVFRTQFETLLLRGLDIPNATYEPDLLLQAQPLMSLYKWVQYPMEAIALAKHNASRPGRNLLWQIAGTDEAASTPAGDALVSVAGVPAVGEFTYAPVTAGVAPIQGSGAWRFPQADHLMIAYRAGSSKLVPPGLPPFELRPTPLKFDNPIDAVYEQLTHFFDTRRATGTAEIR